METIHIVSSVVTGYWQCELPQEHGKRRVMLLFEMGYKTVASPRKWYLNKDIEKNKRANHVDIWRMTFRKEQCKSTAYG